MDKKIRLSVIGGFLGAGKTTTILSIAKMMMAQGKVVGIVTNDQGSDLVDTNFLASHGMSVMEVAGGCFCCNFDEFTAKVNALAAKDMPDIILAEPVGSCTDLVATIYKPLQITHSSGFSLSPLTCVCDPKRAERFLKAKDSGFQSEINYLFSKQLEEADVIYINKTDIYEAHRVDEVARHLAKLYPVATIITGNMGDCAEKLVPHILGDYESRENMELDYDVYGKAESYLGWFNGKSEITAEQNVDFREFVVGFTEEIVGEVQKTEGEIAHLKSYIISSGGFVKASRTFCDGETALSGDINRGTRASVVVNARISIDPLTLNDIVKKCFYYTCENMGVTASEFIHDCFAPGKPDKNARNRVNGDYAGTCSCKSK